VDQVLERALVTKIEPIEWSEADDLASQPGVQVGVPGAAATAH
jgi:ATP-dependent Lon protease